MFLFSEKNRATFDDYRPNVHDSDGLAIYRGDATISGAAEQPAAPLGILLCRDQPAAFGLMQVIATLKAIRRRRAYERARPAGRAFGRWGKGAVRLVEIPSDLEVNDNIVAFWVPDAKPVPGTMMEFAIVCAGALLAADPFADMPSSRKPAPVWRRLLALKPDGTRKFVVDFEGGLLATLLLMRSQAV